MGYFHLNSGVLQDYGISIVDEQHGDRVLQVVMVTIYTELAITKYRIATDETNKDINFIKESFNTGLSAAKNNSSADFRITEDADRPYVLVTFPDGRANRYTGGRV